MITIVRFAHQRYRSHLNSITETKKNKENQVAKKFVCDEIEDVQIRQDQLKKTSEMLQGDFVNFIKEAEEAEEKQDLALISKANAMK